MMLRSRYPILIALFASACAGEAPDPTSPAAGRAPTVVQARPAFARLAREAGGFVSSIDADGMPQFIWAVDQKEAQPAAGAREAAEYHLSRYAPAFDLKSSDLKTADLRFIRDMQEGGWLAKWKQKIGGVEVYPSEVTVLMKKDLSLVAISGRLRRADAGKEEFELSQEAALALSLEAHLAAPMSPENFVRVGEQHFTLAPGMPIQMSAARVKPIFYATKHGLTPAWFAEFYAGPNGSVDTDAYRYILSAVDGRILERRNLEAQESYLYRVWVDASGRPLDGPTADTTPHPAGMPDGSIPPLVAPTLHSQDGFNSKADPWLPNGAVETNGNNVDAYTDHDLPDGFSNADFRAIAVAPRSFDRTYEPALDPVANENQIMASVAALFYTNNWLHDWWYDSGFDEAAGNAQRDNFGRGGEGGDPLHAEAQDNHLRGNRNNANMATPADGLSPRMQMYAWTGAETITLTLTPGGEVPAGTAAFGPRNFNLTGPIVAALDAVAPGEDGCTAITTNVAGRIGLVSRGACTFVVKAANLQAAGAIGVIVQNNAASAIPPALGGADPSITIPVMSVTLADGDALRAALQTGPVTTSMFRQVDVDRDGSFDHTVVAHEWGHYFHHRLADTGIPQGSAMSEGWGDWVSIFMAIRNGDDLNGAFPTGVWATLDNPEASYFGIRRVAYSTDFSRNALTFRNISDGEELPTTAPISPGGPNSEVHNAGEVWTTMLHEAYVALIRAHTSTATGQEAFDTVQRTMGDYIVAGLQLHPRDATYTEARDAILAAAFARDPADMQLLAEAFARRGAGSCAVAPARFSDDFRGVEESFVLGSRISIGSVAFDESLRSCDQDGILDADERGLVRVSVANAGPQTLAGASVTLSSTSAGVLFPAGDTLRLADLAPFSSTEVELEVAVDPAFGDMGSMVLSVRFDGPGSCQTTTTSTVISLINYDEVGGVTVDDVESRGSPWTPTGPESEEIWNRTQITAFDHAWVGTDWGSVSDTWIDSPELIVSTSTSDDFIISWDHRYQFEADTIFWDGGVVEISTDGLAYQDLNDILPVGYVGTLTDTSGNPLALRMAYSGTSTAWPSSHRVSFNLGNAFAGETVRVRFRIGTDAAVGMYGWEIDNFRAQGITNAPFEQLGTDMAACPENLIANAGEDQEVDPGEIVFLSGSGMSFENLPITLSWQQTAGPAVTLTRADTANPVFTAPVQETETVLTFELTVDDGMITATDTVDITVLPTAPAVVTANAGNDQTVDPTTLVILDGTGSTTDGILPLTYAWAQTAGPTVQLSNPTAAVARFTAPAPATNALLTFELTVSDGLHTDTDTIDVTVNGYLLTATAGEDQIVEAGSLVVLDGSGSRSSTNLPLTFSWMQTEGPAVSLENATSAVSRFTAPNVVSDTVLTFAVTVSDGALMSVATVDITVQATEVSADAGMDQSVDAKTTVFLDGSGSLGRNLTYAWTQTAGPMVALANDGGVAPSFTAGAPANPTTLTFELTVSDGVSTDTDTVTVTVRAFEEDGGCDCNATHSGQSSAFSVVALIGLLFFARKRR